MLGIAAALVSPACSKSLMGPSIGRLERGEREKDRVNSTRYLERGERGKDREVSRTPCSRLYILHVVLCHSRSRAIQEKTGETRGSANTFVLKSKQFLSKEHCRDRNRENQSLGDINPEVHERICGTL
jgi:hypothetical protein